MHWKMCEKKRPRHTRQQQHHDYRHHHLAIVTKVAKANKPDCFFFTNLLYLVVITLPSVTHEDDQYLLSCVIIKE